MELGFSVRIGSRFRQSLLPALPLARRRGKIDNGAHVASPGAATQGREQLMKLDGDWLSAGLCLAAGLSMTSFALAADKVSFGTNWLAEAEHGGYYQAVVDGTYAKYGLDVTIVPGGPQANNGLLLAAGKLDFYMGGNLLLSFDAVAQNIPIVVVAAHFQKDPQIVMSHPGVGLDKWSDLPRATAFIGKEGLASFYQWMRTAYGFKEENVKPYTFNPQPFIADKNSIQQGYVTSEPFAVEREGHFKPNIFLFADQGYGTYATTIETRADVVAKKPDLVQRFVDASTIGWYHYLYGDNSQANVLIKKDNPEMTDEQIAFSIGKIKEYGLADSGDTLKLGIGAMTDERIKSFYDSMVKAGVVAPGLDYKKGYTLQFVDKGVGLDLRPK
jgi:NitT/TauT family transport system substrate-binding protein